MPNDQMVLYEHLRRQCLFFGKECISYEFWRRGENIRHLRLNKHTFCLFKESDSEYALDHLKLFAYRGCG